MESESHPVAGVDYPRTFQEMEQWFRDEAACRRLHPAPALAGRVHLPTLRRERRALDDVG